MIKDSLCNHCGRMFNHSGLGPHRRRCTKENNLGENKKKCVSCKVIKPLTEFQPLPAGYLGTFAKCRRCLYEYQSKMRDPEKLRERIKNSMQKYRRKSDTKQKEDARKAAWAALKSGKYDFDTCRDCGSTKFELHHPDYSRPLDVIPLCKKHHVAVHY